MKGKIFFEITKCSKFNFLELFSINFYLRPAENKTKINFENNLLSNLKMASEYFKVINYLNNYF